MGNEAICRVDLNGQSVEAKVLLETEELIFRGALRRKVAFRDAKDVAADGGVLSLRHGDDVLRVHAGDQAAKWAEKIRNPKSVADKLGIKAGLKISIAGTLDDAFISDLEQRGADVSRRVRKASDIIFFAARKREELAERLPSLRDALTPNGALWVIRPKGNADISEADVLNAGRAAGLVDVKVVRFSDTYTAEKLVIPVERRGSFTKS